MSTSALPSTSDRLATWLRADAVLSGTAGLVLAAGAAWLDDELGAPLALLVPLGLFLLAYAGGLLVLARLGAPAPAVAAVVAGNAAWVALSIATVAADWLTLTDLGNVLALAQAGAVALLALLQLGALRTGG